MLSILFLFLMPLANAQTTTPANKKVDPECQIGGCSGEICGLNGDKDMMGICIFKNYFTCFNGAHCAYVNGRCGWKGTDQVRTCLVNKNAEKSVINSLIPVAVKPGKVVDDKCEISGCSKQLCVLKGKGSIGGICVKLDYFSCFDYSHCTHVNERCGWKGTNEVKQCLTDKKAGLSIIKSLNPDS